MKPHVVAESLITPTVKKALSRAPRQAFPAAEIRARPCVDRNTSRVIFLMHLAHAITFTSWLKVSQCAFHSIHMPSMMLHVLSVRLLSLRCLSLSCFSPTSTFFSFTVYLFSVRTRHLQCRHRRGLKPLHSRTMRSVAPWRLYHPLTPRDQPEPDLITEGKSLPCAHKPGSSFDPRTCKSHTCHWW